MPGDYENLIPEDKGNNLIESEQEQTEEVSDSVDQVAEVTGDQNSGGEVVPEVPQFNPQEWALNYKGQQVMPKDRDHLVNLAQKGWSYEQAMEQINREKQEFAKQQGEISRYIELDKAIKADPQFANSLYEFIRQYNEGGQQQQQQNQQQENPEYVQLRQELEDLKSWKQQNLLERAQEQIDSELANLAQRYPNYDWQSDTGSGTLAYRLLKHAHDNNFVDLHTAFKDLMFDEVSKQTKFDTLKQQKEVQQRQAKQGVVQTGSPANVAPKKPAAYSSGDSYNDLYKKALNSFGG